VGLISLFLGAVAVGTDGFMIAGLIPRIAHDLGTGTAVAAQLVTVFAVTYALGAPITASLLRRADRRSALVGALVGLGATNALAAAAPSLTVLFLARVAAALAACQYTPTAAMAAADLVDAEHRGRALSVVTSGLTLSIVTGVPLGALVGDHFGWRITFAGVSGLSVLVAFAVGVALHRSASAPPSASLRTRVAALRRPGVYRVLATTVLGILAGYLGYTYVAPISHAAGASGGVALAMILTGFGAGAVAGAVLSGAGVDRHGQRLVVRFGATLQALALVALAAMDLAGLRLGVVPPLIAFALLGVGSFNYNAPQQHRLIELAPDDATILVSLNSSAIYAGIGLSGALGGLALAFGPATNCLTGAAIALLAALIAAPIEVRADAGSRS
jgi:predicted MFS family arabinose efflux permease